MIGGSCYPIDRLLFPKISCWLTASLIGFVVAISARPFFCGSVEYVSALVFRAYHDHVQDSDSKTVPLTRQLLTKPTLSC